ncbi:hypothetical protein LXL04_016744 [Taraxacum kok-saghyz]
MKKKKTQLKISIHFMFLASICICFKETWQRFIKHSSPGIIATALAHIGKSYHPMNLHLDHFLPHDHNLLPGFESDHDVSILVGLPHEHVTIFRFQYLLRACEEEKEERTDKLVLNDIVKMKNGSKFRNSSFDFGFSSPPSVVAAGGGLVPPVHPSALTVLGTANQYSNLANTTNVTEETTKVVFTRLQNVYLRASSRKSFGVYMSARRQTLKVSLIKAKSKPLSTCFLLLKPSTLSLPYNQKLHAHRASQLQELPPHACIMYNKLQQATGVYIRSGNDSLRRRRDE